MAGITQKKPVLMFFQEIRPGDVAKQNAASNIATTGGGARDLRIQPAAQFAKILEPMFPDATAKPGVFEGQIHWLNPTLQSDTIKFWRPTVARPNEARIGRINFIHAWSVNEPKYKIARDAGMKWFYLLVMDAGGVVWARLLQEENLGQENKAVREYITKRIEETSASHAVRGTMNFATKQVYP